MSIFHIYGLILQSALILTCSSDPFIIDLDDSFNDKKSERPWLVEFYAPWCGHCRKLAPIYQDTAASLRTSHPEILVAKLDATKYPSIASDYGVRGYPTIKFIQGDLSYLHRGDRSKEGITEFAKRALGPRVRWLDSLTRLTDVKREHRDQVFFLYVGPKVDDSIGTEEAETNLYSAYKSLAAKFAILGYFYAIPPGFMNKDIKLLHDPTVIVFKDQSYFEFQQNSEIATNDSLDEFISGERLAAFPRILGGGLNEMAESKKKIVIAVVGEREEEEMEKNAKYDRFKEVIRGVAIKHRDKYHEFFQFIWMDDVETVTSITMTTLPLPYLVVFDPQTQFYYFPEGQTEQVTADSLMTFLDQLMADKIQAYGGTGVLQRFKRLFFDIAMTILDIYKASPWLALLVFGIPTAVISIVCYALCCMEVVDEDATYGNKEDDSDNEELINGSDQAIENQSTEQSEPHHSTGSSTHPETEETHPKADGTHPKAD